MTERFDVDWNEFGYRTAAEDVPVEEAKPAEEAQPAEEPAEEPEWRR